MWVSALIVLGLLAGSDVEEAERLVARQESALAGIRTLRATILPKHSVDGGATWTTVQETQVLKSGRKELTRTKLGGATFRGTWRPGQTETADLFEPDEARSLAISPSGTGSRNSPPAEMPGGWVNHWKTQLMLIPGPTSYRELVEKGKVRAVRSEGADGSDVVITVEPREAKPIRSYRLTFSPKHAYLVIKQEKEYLDEIKDQGKLTRSATSEVLDFWELGPGRTLPKTIRVTKADEPAMVVQVELRDVVCNETISPGELQLTFPEGIVVVDNRTGIYHLWGKGQPARTFESNEDFMDWQRAQDLAKRKPRPILKNPWVWVAATAFATLVALVVVRRRAARA